MINIEKRVETALYKSAYQGLKIYFEPLRGKPFHITSLDLVEGSFKITMTSTSTNNMQIGNMSANDLSMELMNPTDSWGFGKFDDVYFCGATMRLKLLVYDQVKDEMTETPFGVYIIDNQPRALDTIKITAFNNVIRLDTPFKASDLPTSMTLYDLVDEGLRRAGLAHDDSIQIFPSNALGGLDVTKIKSEQVISWRQVVKWCCECVGVNAISDENGIIKFVFYDKYTPDVLRDEDDLNLETEDGEILLIDDTPTTDFQITPALRYADNSSEIAEEDVVITGFQFKVDDVIYPKLKTEAEPETEQEPETEPETERVMNDYILQSENNLVFYALNEDGRKTMAETVNAKLAGFTYRPFKCNTLSFPHLQTFDSVVYIKDGKRHHSIITDIVYKLNGDMMLTAKGKNKEQKAWEVLGALTPKQQAIIDSVSRKVDNTREQLSSYENALLLFNEKMLHSMGLYKTVETDANGGMIVYFHDKTTLDKSNAIYMFGASGFAWTTDGWKDGNPVWHYGFTDTGDAIFSEVQAYKISADLIQTGYLRSQNGASWINMDNGTFSFRSVKDAWMDLDTNEMNYSYEDKLKLDESGELGVYGTLKSTKYKNLSISIGKSQNDSYGSLIVSDSDTGDLMSVRSALNASGNGALWSVPMLADKFGTNVKGIYFYPNEISLWNAGKTRVTCDDDQAYLKCSDAYIGVYKDQISIGTTPYNHDHIWFNYHKPKYGRLPTAYDFGNGEGGHAQVFASKIGCGFYDTIVTDNICAALKGGVTIGNFTSNDFYYKGYTLSVYGSAKAYSWEVLSDLDSKENIVPVPELNALQKIKDLNFYAYDLIKSGKITRQNSNSTAESDVTDSSHVPIGLVASEAPTEIQAIDGKGIDLYRFISVTAKAVQELNTKCEAQSKTIDFLETRIEKLEEIITNLIN